MPIHEMGNYGFEFSFHRYPAWDEERFALFPFICFLAIYGIVPGYEDDPLIKMHRRTLAVDPNDVQTRFMLGNCLRMQGRFPEARAEYEKVVASGDSSALYTAQKLLKEAAAGGWEEDVPSGPTFQLWRRFTLLHPLSIPCPPALRPRPTYDVIKVWRELLEAHPTTIAWVLFEHGTCVLVRDNVLESSEANEADFAATATEILREWGPVYAGSPSADFSVSAVQKLSGWIVTCHHSDVLNYVGPREIRAKNFDQLEGFQKTVQIGTFGRSKRNKDAKRLKVIHVEQIKRA